MSILLFIVILAILIIAHEFGHFIAAKKSGIRVDEFGIGFPPRLLKKTYGETTYSINAFPVGGFVKIFGENPDEESINGKDSSRSFVHKSKLIQAWVISAGIIFNLLFAWILVSVGFMVGLPFSADDERYGDRVVSPILTIVQVMPGTPAETAGIKPGDKIIALYGSGDSLDTPGINTTKRFIAEHDEITFSYLRDKEIRTVNIVPAKGVLEGQKGIGISMDHAGILKLSPHEALYAGLLSTADLTGSTATSLLNFFKGLFTGSAVFSQVSGPVGIVGVVANASEQGFASLLLLTALISINLALINLLPFPALDGGRLFFILIEAIKGSSIKPIIANTANGIGFILLILLMVVVTYHDIVKLMTN